MGQSPGRGGGGGARGSGAAASPPLTFKLETVQLVWSGVGHNDAWAISASDELLKHIQDIWREKGVQEHHNPVDAAAAVKWRKAGLHMVRHAGKLYLGGTKSDYAQQLPGLLRAVCHFGNSQVLAPARLANAEDPTAALVREWQGRESSPVKQALISIGCLCLVKALWLPITIILHVMWPLLVLLILLNVIRPTTSRWHLIWPKSYTEQWELVLLPMVPPPSSAVASALTGEEVLYISRDTLSSDFRNVVQGFAVALPPDYSSKVVLAWMVPALERSGYELVAPKHLAAHSRNCREQETDFGVQFQQLRDRDLDGPLVFIQQARLKSVEDHHLVGPPGDVTVQVDENGVVSGFAAPDEVKLIIEEVHPWVCSDMTSRLRGTNLPCAPKLCKVLTSSVIALGYKPVSAPVESVAGIYHFFRASGPPSQPQEPVLTVVEQRGLKERVAADLQAKWQAQAEEFARRTRDELQSALRERDALLAEVLESQRAGRETMEALREQVEGQRALQASRAVEFDDFEAKLQALAEEQRSLRGELQQAVRERDSLLAEVREKQPGRLQAVEDWRVKVYDADSGTASAAKHICIECPGVDANDIAFQDLGNGVHVHIAVADGSRADFDRDFYFDHRKDGFFELRPDEFVHENGILLLVLKRTMPKRMKLKHCGAHPAHHAPLPTVSEEVQGERSKRAPMYFDIASVHREGSRADDSRSITSEAKSWWQVGADARASAWPESEQDAMSVGKDSLGRASQQSSWVVPDYATASLPPSASQAWPPVHTLASSGAGSAATPPVKSSVSSRAASASTPPVHSAASSGAASAATVHSVASAPARGTTPCCFLPRTAFWSVEKKRYVAAAALNSAGGDRLLGPSGSEVLVRRAKGHAPVERDLVSLRLCGVRGAFVVTADHRLLTRGPNGEPVVCTGGDFVRGSCRCLYNGTDFHVVELAEHYTQSCRVVEVSFEGDGVALAWVLPRRSRSSEERIPVAVPGKEPTLGDDGVCEQRTFLDCPCVAHSAAAGPRSLSVGARPLPTSSWSAGSRGHDDRHPEKCNVCTYHHLYLKNLRGPNAASAVPCVEGAACSRCHAPHPEYRRGGRSP